MSTSFLDAIAPILPTELSNRVSKLQASHEDKETLENLLRFVLGAQSSWGTLPQEDWSEKQADARSILEGIVPPSSDSNKRNRDEDGSSDAQTTKRAKIQSTGAANGTSGEDRGNPLFILHSISTTSPIRKKVDIKVYPTTLVFENPGTNAVEAEVSIKSLTRAFLLPTRGKSKAHWTVVLITIDSPATGKGASNDPSHQQVIFGIDAKATAPLTTTIFSPDPSRQVLPKGSDTLPAVQKFLSHLPIPLLKPSVEVFRSATGGGGPSGNGIPGIEAYRAAKAGSLWFMKEGILWGESKPCEFWSIEDLINKTEGLRIIGGTGRTCSVILTRKSKAGDDEEDVINMEEGEETQFSVIDAKEQDPINEWVRRYRHLFGAVDGQPPPTTKAQGHSQNAANAGRVTLANAQFDDDDVSDTSFEAESSDGGSASSSDDDDDRRSSGPRLEEEAEDVSDEGSEDLDAEEEELDPARHPLFRPGAVPKMSRAAIDMVVNMVEDDLMGGHESDGEDELDD